MKSERSKRQSKILELINNSDIYTQDELTNKLSSNGIMATQATISRDIKDLKILKIPASNDQYKYAIVNRDKEKTEINFINRLKETVKNLKTARNLLIIHTDIGCAQAAAAAIDAINFPEVIGTIAGDDTLLMVFATDENAETISQELTKIIDNI